MINYLAQIPHETLYRLVEQAETELETLPYHVIHKSVRAAHVNRIAHVKSVSWEITYKEENYTTHYEQDAEELERLTGRLNMLRGEVSLRNQTNGRVA